MIVMNNENTSSAQQISPELTENETIRQLARRHLRDKSHTTTDDELRNAKIELSNVAGVNKINLYAVESYTISNPA